MPFPKLLATTAPNATVLVRILVGAVFLSEGIQKFLFSAALGVGRFEKIGIPSPVIAAPFVGMIEVICRETVDRGIADSRCVGRSVAEYFPSRSCPPRFLSCLGRDSWGSSAEDGELRILGAWPMKRGLISACSWAALFY